MIDVKNEDFDKYRKNLYKYALRLLETKGSANTASGELDEKAKDIVQESYITFHNNEKNVFVTEQHLKNFLNIVLYRKYQESINPRSKSAQQSEANKFVISEIDTDKTFGYNQSFFDNATEEFMKTLNDKQRFILNKLLSGFTQSEVSKDEKVSRQAISLHICAIKKKYLEYERRI